MKVFHTLIILIITKTVSRRKIVCLIINNCHVDNRPFPKYTNLNCANDTKFPPTWKESLEELGMIHRHEIEAKTVSTCSA